jgi:phospholipase/carboxylesterase
MPLQTIEIETAPNPTACIVILHGLGADGNDFVPICDELDLEAVGPVRFVLPHGPVRPVTINAGMKMRAWYDIYQGAGTDRREDEAGLRASQAEIEALLTREAARGIPAARTVLMGFSQGCAMTLMTGLRHTDKLAGLVALSGYLPLADMVAAESSPANRTTPIFMAHGTADHVVPHDRGVASRNALAVLGYDIEWHDYPMAHSVHPREIVDLNRWLLKVLAPAG